MELRKDCVSTGSGKLQSFAAVNKVYKWRNLRQHLLCFFACFVGSSSVNPVATSLVFPVTTIDTYRSLFFGLRFVLTEQRRKTYTAGATLFSTVTLVFFGRFLQHLCLWKQEWILYNVYKTFNFTLTTWTKSNPNQLNAFCSVLCRTGWLQILLKSCFSILLQFVKNFFNNLLAESLIHFHRF